MGSHLEHSKPCQYLAGTNSHTLFSLILSRFPLDLLDLYCQLFLSPHPSYDRTLLAKTIHTIVSLSSSQCDITADKLYSFFTKAFENIKSVPYVCNHCLQ